MTANDIKRLRMQSIMGGSDIPDIMGGMEGYPSAPRISPMEQDPFGGASPAYPTPAINDSDMNAGGMYDEETGPPPPTVKPPSVSTFDAANMKAMLDQFYTPETTSRDRFNRLLDATPEREEPGWARKLVASGMGWGAKDPIKTMEDVMYAPHARAIADWKERTGPFQQAAQLENIANVNERTLAGNIVTAKTQADRLAETGRIADEKNEISRIRAMAQDYKAHGYTIKEEGSRLVAINPHPPFDKKDMGPSGNMDQRDLENLKGEWGVKAAEARGEAAVKTAVAGTQAAGRGVVQIGDKLYEPDPDNPGNYREITGVPPGTATRPGTPPHTPAENATQRAVEVKSKWNEVYANYPDLRKWMTRLPDGTFALKQKPTMGSWLQSDQADMQDIAEYEALEDALAQRGIGPKAETKSPFGTGIGGGFQTPRNNQVGPTGAVGRGTKVSPDRGDQTQMPSNRVMEGEVEVIDKQTGKHLAMQRGNLQKAIATGRYELVK